MFKQFSKPSNARTAPMHADGAQHPNHILFYTSTALLRNAEDAEFVVLPTRRQQSGTARLIPQRRRHGLLPAQSVVRSRVPNSNSRGCVKLVLHP
jgi:hypothetical protein